MKLCWMWNGNVSGPENHTFLAVCIKLYFKRGYFCVGSGGIIARVCRTLMAPGVEKKRRFSKFVL